MSDKLRDNRAGARDLRPLAGLLPYLRPHWGRALLAGFSLVAAALTVLGFGEALRYLVDEGLSEGDPGLLDKALGVLFWVVLGLGIFTYIRFYLVSWLGERLVADLRRDVFSAVVRMDVGFFEVNRTGEIVSRLTADTGILQTAMGSSVSVALRHALLLAGGLALLVWTSPTLSLYVLAAVPAVVGPILLFGRKVRRLSRESQDRLGDLGAVASEKLYGIRTVHAFAQEDAATAGFQETVDAAFSAANRRIRMRSAMTALVIFLVFGAVGGILWAGGRAVIAGDISGGQLSAFVFYAVMVAGAVGALSEVAGEVQRAAGAAERLLELRALTPSIAAPAIPRHLPEKPKGELVFDHVDFAYPARPGQLALSGFSAVIRPGEKLALVGPSGAGKTTVLNLALRFYDPSAGHVRLDGVDIAALDPAELRRHIGLVPQEPVIFSGDVASNIRFGRPEASEEELREAARAAHALDFIERLPEGFATQLGERGVTLSGGQRQRLAIARAVLRNPRLLLLDEATSALDAESERAVQMALERLTEGRTVIAIAHRLATVKHADRILVMEEGRLAAEGSHAELVEEGGLYARLARLQFREAV
jgi:ATP-binding cassette subfamily B protein